MLRKRGSANDPGNYRPIALINCIAKVFSNILLNRLTDWAILTRAVPETQSGFRKGRSCLDNIFTLTSIIQIHLRLKRRQVYAAFVDFKAAFDSVNRSLLWRKLYNLGVSALILNVLQSIYSNASFSVKLQNSISREFPSNKGVLQGDPLSPLIFSLFISDLEDHFRSTELVGLNIDNYHDLICLLYADDLVILADSESDLARKLNSLKKYCNDNDLTVNTQKSKIVRFSRGGRPSTSQRAWFDFGEGRIEVVKKYTYLGVTFSSSGLFSEMAQLSVIQSRQAIGQVMRFLSQSRVISWEARITLYKSLILSVLLYGVGIWGLRYLDVIERAQVWFYKRLLLLPRNTPDCLVRLETGSVKLAYNAFKLSLGWLQKILAMPSHRLPKLCFLRLLNLNIRDDRYSWVTQLKGIYSKLDASEFWDNPTLGNHELLKHRLLDSYQQLLTSEDMIAYNASQFPLFTFTFANSPQPYLLYNIHINYLRIFAQLRLCHNSQLRVFHSGSLNVVDFSEICSICNLNAREDLLHLFVECPHYNWIRAPAVRRCIDYEDIQALLINPRIADLKDVVHFITHMLKLRAFLCNE